MFARGYSLLLLTGLTATMAAAAVAPRPGARAGRPIPVEPVIMRSLPPAIIDDTLAIAGDDVKSRLVSTRLTVAVHVNGRGPYQFVVDSGADSSVVGHRIARTLQLPAGTSAILNGTTASARVDRVLVDALTVGPSTIRNLEVPALLEADLGAEGIVGIDALVEQRLMMDFEKRLIKVEDARRPAVMLDGEIVVIARRRRGQLILTEVDVAGHPVEAVVDTGSEVSIGNLALRDKLIRRNRDKFIIVEIVGVTGVPMKLQMALIGELRLGKVVVRNLPIAFADVPPFKVFGLDRHPSLLLGTDVLETFRRVSLDFRRRKVRFQLRRCGTTGIVMSTAPSSIARLSSDSGAVCRR